MVYYDRMSEEWVDTEDEEWYCPMTPEGGVEDLTFKTKEDFYKWLGVSK